MRLPSALVIVVAAALACSKSDAIDKPFFYAAAKDGKTTYLLGTMHIGIDPKKLPAIVHEKYDAAKVIVTETDPDGAASLGFGRRKGAGTLRDDLGADYWAKLERRFDGGMPPGIDQMHPAVVVLQLQIKGAPPYTMDAELRTKARQTNKQLAHLEPVSKQIALIERWFDLRMLKAELDDLDPKAASKMRAIYRSGDETALIDYFHASMAKATSAGFTQAEIDQMTEDFLYERNRSWITTIEKLHSSGDVFIAVGAAHLVGKQSVLELLEARGFTITRVTP